MLLKWNTVEGFYKPILPFFTSHRPKFPITDTCKHEDSVK